MWSVLDRLMDNSEYEQVERQFNPMTCWQCKHCGDLIFCDFGEMVKHLESCKEYEDSSKK